jgi:hypothetical protein
MRTGRRTDMTRLIVVVCERAKEIVLVRICVNTHRVIKSRRMRWTGHVARMGRGGVYTGFGWENLMEKEHL